MFKKGIEQNLFENYTKSQRTTIGVQTATALLFYWEGGKYN